MSKAEIELTDSSHCMVCGEKMTHLAARLFVRRPNARFDMVCLVCGLEMLAAASASIVARFFT